MILAALGVGMMVAGIGLVVLQTGQSWSRPATSASEQPGEKPKSGISYPAVGLIGAGAALVMLATSGWL